MSASKSLIPFVLWVYSLLLNLLCCILPSYFQSIYYCAAASSSLRACLSFTRFPMASLALLLIHLSIWKNNNNKTVPTLTPLHNVTLKALSDFVVGNWRPYLQRLLPAVLASEIASGWSNAVIAWWLKEKSVAFKSAVIIGSYRVLSSNSCLMYWARMKWGVILRLVIPYRLNLFFVRFASCCMQTLSSHFSHLQSTCESASTWYWTLNLCVMVWE